jgi:ribosomal-protein-serine acetyltransferase
VWPIELSDTHALRLVRESDASELAALIDANRMHLAQWLPWAAGNRLEDTRQFMRQAVRQHADDNGFQAAIVRPGPRPRIVGVIGFHVIQWPHRWTSLGYWMDAAEQGRGTMTRAVRAMLEHAFGTWELNRVEIRAATDNHRSRAIPERLGFRQEGTLRQVERVGGRFLDHAVYGLLAEEWSALATRTGEATPGSR